MAAMASLRDWSSSYGPEGEQMEWVFPRGFGHILLKFTIILVYSNEWLSEAYCISHFYLHVVETVPETEYKQGCIAL